MPVIFFPKLLYHWNYESDFFGKDILKNSFEQRALLGTYRKLALLKNKKILVLSDQKRQAFYNWDDKDNSLINIRMEKFFLEETISWYQTADYLFTNKQLK